MLIRFLSTVILGATWLGLSSDAFALEVQLNKVPNRSIFGVEFAGSPAQFYAKADRVIGVSWQEYTTGTFVVSEVVVDLAESSQQLRLYATRLVTSDDVRKVAARTELPAGNGIPTPTVVRAAESRVGSSVEGATSTMPVKVYPTTTHARTIEYQVSDVAELHRFYREFRNLWAGFRLEVTPTDAKTDPVGPVTTQSPLGGVLFLIKP